MEFNLKDMDLKELDNLIDAIYDEKTRRAQEKLEKYINEIDDLFKRMNDDGIEIRYLSEDGFETADECWIEKNHIRIR